MDGRKRGVGCVWATEGITLLQTIIDGCQIALGEDYVRIENNQPVAMGALSTVVATLSRAAVLLGIIMQNKDVCVFVANILASLYRPVFHNNYLEVLLCLIR